MTSQASTAFAEAGGLRPRTADVDAPGTGIDLADMLRILSERRYIILGIAILGLVLGIAASLLMTPLYRAVAVMELNPPQTEVLSEAASGRPAQSSSGQELLATQIGLLKSDSLARRVAQDLNLMSRPDFGGTGGTRQQRVDRSAAVLQNNTLIDTVKGSMLIRVNYSSPDPALAARIANALAKGFIASSLERRYDSSSYARDFLRNQLAATKSSLEDSERMLNAYAIQAGIFRTPGQTANGVTTEGSSLAASNLISINEALNQVRIKRINAEQAYRNGSAGSAGLTDGTADLRAQRAVLNAEYEDKIKLFKPDYPEMQQLASRISAMDRAIAGTKTVTTSGRQTGLLADFRAAQDAERALAQQVSSLKGDVQTERSRAIQYGILQREVDTNRALYDALLQRFKEIGVAGGIGRSNISLVDDAEAPQSPYRPNLPLNALLGISGGIALGVALAILAHLLLDNLVTPNDLRTKLGLPVFGVIPIEKDGRSLFETLDDRKSDVSEAYYSVATSIRFAEADGLPKSLMITSTRPGEGKSTSAYAIASTFARSGVKVLLIDADLRKPTFVSQQADPRGLAHLLSSDDQLAKYVESTKTENLSLLPVGKFNGSAAELLASSRLPHIVKEATDAFDFVIFDGPPVLGFADAPLIGALTEKAIIVVESREARTGAVAEMLRRLRASGTVVAGAILTKVDNDSSSYGYNYYSYSYGSDGAGGRVTSAAGRSIDVGGTKPGAV